MIEMLIKRQVRKHLQDPILFSRPSHCSMSYFHPNLLQVCARIWSIQVILACTVVRVGVSLSWNVQVFIFLSSSESFFAVVMWKQKLRRLLCTAHILRLGRPLSH